MRQARRRRHWRNLAFGAAIAATVLGILAACLPAPGSGAGAPPPGAAVSGLHAPGWKDPSSGEFHGKIVMEAGLDASKARWNGVACNVCHAAKDPLQASPVKTAPSCFGCHAGGPDGSPGHPPGFMDVASPFFHGLVVKAAGFDYKAALSGTLACSTCHAGDSPIQVSPNSRAPNCFFCHTGGPDGSAGHPESWGFTFGPRLTDYTGPPSCTRCHGSLPSPRPGVPHPAALALDAAEYVGIAAPVTLTVTDPGADRDGKATRKVWIWLESLGEPGGEAFPLAETAAGSGTFIGALRLERVFGEDGISAPIASNGRLAVYAEGGVPTDSIKVSYGKLWQSASYTEPPSTVTGIVRVGGVPGGGSGLVLAGGPVYRTTTSRSDGSYAFHDVPPGSYTLMAARNGARQMTRTVVVP